MVIGGSNLFQLTPVDFKLIWRIRMVIGGSDLLIFKL